MAETWGTSSWCARRLFRQVFVRRNRQERAPDRTPEHGTGDRARRAPGGERRATARRSATVNNNHQLFLARRWHLCKTTWTRFRRSIGIDLGWGLELTNYRLGATRTCSDECKTAAAAASLIVAAGNRFAKLYGATTVHGHEVEREFPPRITHPCGRPDRPAARPSREGRANGAQGKSRGHI